jgi:hypothetical protein
MRHLRSLVHVSSAYVNMNFPRSSVVHEQVYPLKHGDQDTDAEEIAKVSNGGILKEPVLQS